MTEDELVCERCGMEIGPFEQYEVWSSDGKPRHKDGCPGISEDDEFPSSDRPSGGVH